MNIFGLKGMRVESSIFSSLSKCSCKVDSLIPTIIRIIGNKMSITNDYLSLI